MDTASEISPGLFRASPCQPHDGLYYSSRQSRETVQVPGWPQCMAWFRQTDKELKTITLLTAWRKNRKRHHTTRRATILAACFLWPLSSPFRCTIPRTRNDVRVLCGE